MNNLSEKAELRPFCGADAQSYVDLSLDAREKKASLVCSISYRSS